MAETPLATAVLGIGSIGRAIVRALLAEPEVSLVGVVDHDPALVGRPLSELVPGAPANLTIAPNLNALWKRLEGGVLLVAASSRIGPLRPLFQAALRAGVHVVSTCEELAFPWLSDEAGADALDALARKHQVSILGTGVCPGFVTDRLPALAGAALGPVRHLRAVRHVSLPRDVATRAPAYARSLGLGLSEDAFDAAAQRDEVGLAGLHEAASLAGLGLGLDLDEFEEELSPIIAGEPLPAMRIAAGEAVGLSQRIRAFCDGHELVDLEVTASADIEEPFDRVTIDAEPPVEILIKGGYPREEATAWSVVRAALRAPLNEPGLLTVLDLPTGR